MNKPAPTEESHLELALEPARQVLDAETRAAIWVQDGAMSVDETGELAFSLSRPAPAAERSGAIGAGDWREDVARHAH